MTDADQELSRLFRRFAAEGSPDALAEVYDRTAPSLLRLAIHLAADAAQAEDLVQATFVTAIEKARTFDTERPLRPWLSGILSGHANNLRRKNTRRKAEASSELPHDVLEDPEAIDPLDAAALEEFDAEIDRAIDELPESYRPVLVLRLRHGMIAADIAHALRRPPGTVRTQLVRGLERLRKTLPAGVAAILAGFAMPTRGLAAVRAELLDRLPPAPIDTATPVAATTTALVMKKWIAAVAVLLLSIATWQVLDEPPETPTPSSESISTAPRGSNTSEEPSQTSRLAAVDQRPTPGAASAPGWSLTGRIDPTPGIPFDGATIEAYRGAPEDRPLRMSSIMNSVNLPGVAQQTFEALRTEGEPLAVTEIDPTGAFRFDDLPAPDVRLRLRHRFYSLRETFPAHRNRRESVDLGTLPTVCGGQILGRITNDVACKVMLIAEADAMEPVRDLPGFLARTAQIDSLYAENEPGQGFRFDAIPPSASVHLMALRAGRATTPPFPVGAGEIVEVLLRPVPTTSLGVRVVDMQGQPIQGANVAARGRSTGGIVTRQLGRIQRETDADGWVVLEPLNALSEANFEVAKRGFVGSSGSLRLSTTETNQIEVQLSRGRIIEGVVVDRDGSPIPDAGVAFVPEVEVPMVGSARTLLGNSAFGPVAEKSRIRTDAEGRFTLSGIAEDAAPNSHAVVAYAEGLSTGSATIPENGEVRITLLPPAIVTGRITNDTDAPVEVRAITRVMGMLDRTIAIADITEEKPRRFELALEPGSHTISVRGPDLAELRKRISVEAGERLDLGDITLAQASTIRGRVLDHEGLPVAFAMVTRKRGGLADNPILAFFNDEKSVRTDEEGRFELGDLPGGRVILLASAKDRPTTRSERLQLGEGQTLDGVVLQLSAPGRIEGRLLLPPGADPRDWTVLAESTTKMATRTTSLDFDGSFVFEGLDEGAWNVSAMDISVVMSANEDMMDSVAKGRGMDVAGLVRGIQNQTVMARIDVTSGETAALDLDARFVTGTDGIQVALQIRDGSDDMETGLVEFSQVDDAGVPQLSFAFIDRGYAQLDRARPGPATIQIRSGLTLEPVGIQQTIQIGNGPISEHRIDLPGGGVAGVVRDDTGTALAGALISLRRDNREPSITTSDAEGRFRFRSLAQGRYEIQVVSDIRSAADTLSARRTIDVDGTTSQIDLTAERGAEVQAIVTGPAGAPLSGASILVVDTSGTPIGPQGARRTDATGTAYLSGLPSAEVHLIVSHDGLATQISAGIDARSGQQSIQRIQLDRGADCTLQIVDQNDAPIRLQRSGATRLRTQLQNGPAVDAFLLGARPLPDGTIDLGSLPPGPARFELLRENGPTAVERTIPASRSARILLRF